MKNAFTQRHQQTKFRLALCTFVCGKVFKVTPYCHEVFHTLRSSPVQCMYKVRCSLKFGCSNIVFRVKRWF